MGIFDYVELSRELKERLGKYGRDNYQTKYMVEEGFIRVYHGVDKYRSLWSLLIWIELLVEPKPSHLDMEPLLRTVKLDDIGNVRLVDVSVALSTYIFNVEEVRERLGKLGFKGPKKRECEELRHITEELCVLHLRNGRAELEFLKAKDEKSPLGIKTLLRIKSGDVEVIVKPGVLIRVSSHTVSVERSKLVFQKVLEEEWSKEAVIANIKVDVEALIRHGGKAEGTLGIRSSMKLDPQSIREELVDKLVELVEDTAKKTLL